MTLQEEIVDVTERVTCYKNGKVFECECGQRIGVKLKRCSIRCAGCGKACVDKDWATRQPVTQTGQTNLLSDF